MSFIDTVDEGTAEGETAAIYSQDRESLGYVANYSRAFSHRPEVMRGWQQLNRAIRSNMDLRHYELATLAAALMLRSSYCSLAHGKVLAAKFYSPEEVVDISRREPSAPLTEGEVALMEFAAKVAERAFDVSQADVDVLRRHGFSDPEIFDIAAAAAARCFFSKLLDATGAEPDPAYRGLDPELQSALTVGKPIAGGE
jgi:uncharacterized peroxidase-related enzyme